MEFGDGNKCGSPEPVVRDRAESWPQHREQCELLEERRLQTEAGGNAKQRRGLGTNSQHQVMPQSHCGLRLEQHSLAWTLLLWKPFRLSSLPAPLV